MGSIQSILQALLGLVFTFTGGNLFRSSPALGGFLIGGVVAVNAGQLAGLPAFAGAWTPLILFILGGVLGALISIPLHGVIFIATAAAFGLIVGAVAGYLASQQGITSMVVTGVFEITSVSPLQTILMIVFAAGFAALSVRFDEMMIMASTAYLGALIAMGGLANLAGSRLPVFQNGLFLGFAWFTLGLLGWIWQNYHQDS